MHSVYDFQVFPKLVCGQFVKRSPADIRNRNLYLRLTQSTFFIICVINYITITELQNITSKMKIFLDIQMNLLMC